MPSLSTAFPAGFLVLWDTPQPQLHCRDGGGKFRAETFPGAGSVLGLVLPLKTRENQILKFD